MRKLFPLCLLIAILVGCRQAKKPEPRHEAPAAQAAPEVQTDSAIILTEYDVGSKIAENRLVRGFFEPHGDWRYTAKNFALTVDIPEPLAPTLLDLDFNVPGELISAVSDVTMTCRFNGQEVLKRKFTTPGRRSVEIRVPTPLLAKSPQTRPRVDHGRGAVETLQRGGPTRKEITTPISGWSN